MGIFLGKNWLHQVDRDKENELRRAELEYATAAINHAERPIENLSSIQKTAASLSGVDGADQRLARGCEVRQDLLVNPETDKTFEGWPEGGCADRWGNEGFDPAKYTQ